MKPVYMHPFEQLLLVTAKTLRDQYPNTDTRARLDEAIGRAERLINKAPEEPEKEPDAAPPAEPSPETNGAAPTKTDETEAPAPAPTA